MREIRSVSISEETYQRLKEYCKRNNHFIKGWLEWLINKELDENNND